MRVLSILFCLIWGPFALRAQVFMQPFDPAGSMGMAGATVAYPGLSNGMSNNCQLAFGDKLAVLAGSALPYSLRDWQTGFFQGAIGAGRNAGLGVGVFHSGTDLYVEQRFQLAYGRKLAERLYLGGSADVLHYNADEYGSATAVSFSISLLVQALPQVWIGANLFNPLQQKMRDEYLPAISQIGAVWKPSDVFLMAMEMEKDLGRPLQVKTGIEYRPNAKLAVRTGVRAGKVARLTAGLGFRLKNGLALDAATEWHPVLGITPSAMLSWRKP